MEELFIVGTYQVARYSGRGTGNVVTLEELREMFGIRTEELIDEIDWYGSAIRAKYE